MAAISKETTSRTDQLQLWLDRVNANFMWSAKIPGGKGAKIEAHNINGQCALVLRFANKDGWELFVPASNRNEIAHTIDAAAIALGVEGCRGLINDAAHIAKAKGGA